MKTKKRYFNVEQFSIPEGMFDGERKVNISDLEKKCKEITLEDAMYPSWGNGTISVDEDGNWNWIATNYDSSG